MCVVVIINNVQIMISAPAAVVLSGFLWRLKRSRTLASKHAYIVHMFTYWCNGGGNVNWHLRDVLLQY